MTAQAPSSPIVSGSYAGFLPLRQLHQYRRRTALARRMVLVILETDRQEDQLAKADLVYIKIPSGLQVADANYDAPK